MSKEDFVMNEYVREVLQDELLRNDAFLTEEEIKTLLAEDEDKEYRTRETIIGYPIHPLYRELGNMLTIWMQEKYCPALNLPKYDLLDEKTYAESRNAVIASITPLLEGLKTLWTMWGREEIKFRIREVLLLLGKRGILDLFGIRKTVGTKEIWPVSKEKLIKSFKEKHSPNSELWVGARALAKHFHRDNSNSWWGTSTGTEMDKNEHALKTLNKIMDNATWINIHWLPHDVIIVEMRQEEGYGARWLADGSMFRGFLEPQMVDGHDVGWRH
ncbi:uncharacterized protein LOC124262547 [Haliotis rubra]|uniref:uncharacterized protein LOC124262547 n=1 Tax=Haliotis rubra TaxID=36100 RepID=UPI001EE5110E|nr:uncharacterized protein LOC124262547 [Haliotis rubra]XP_046553009.1 uncharacterized protein LOC124262547 [Haliotis rubra]